MDSSLAVPQSDVKVFKEYPSRHSALPQRDIFYVEIVDSQSGIPQVLDSLQRSGPLHFKGWVHIEETKHASVKNIGKFVYIFGEIIEWTHQYDPERPKRPIFWLKSHGVGWYKIESVTNTYEPYFAPLVKVCSYLDVLVQLVVEMRVEDNLHVLIPQVAVLLAEPESMVLRMIQRHRKQLLELGASDSIIRGSNFYKTWAAEQASEPAGSSGRIGATHPPDVSGHTEYDTLTDEMETNTDSEIDVRSNHSTYDHYHSHANHANNSDSNATASPRASKPLLPIVSYDIIDREVIPELETKEETYEELPAPCGDDFCYLHPMFTDLARNAISDDMQLLSNKFAPSRSRLLSSQMGPVVKVEPGLELYSGIGEELHTSGSWSVSDPGSFFCPVQGCLITICNTTIPTSKEFIATISQHIGTHDLSEGDTERVLRAYLAKPWKRPTRPKAWDVTAKQLNAKTTTLNLHAYWMLNAKKGNDHRAPIHVSTTTSTRSTRKRTTSQAMTQITPSSSSTSSPRSTPLHRQPRAASTSSVMQFLESTEATPSTTTFHHLANGTAVPAIESTRTSIMQKVIPTLTSTANARRSPSPERERYRRHERESSSSSMIRRGTSKRRRAPSNDSNVSGEEEVGFVRKRQNVGHPCSIGDFESDEGAGAGTRTGRVNGAVHDRSPSRGRTTVRTNAMPLLRRSSRSVSKARSSTNANGTELRRSTRSQSKPRPPGNMNAKEKPSAREARRSRSRGRVNNFVDNYEDNQLELESGAGVDDSGSGSGPGPTFVYQSVSIQERGRSRTTKRIERTVLRPETNGSLMISKLFNVYRAPPLRPSATTVPMFMRCYRCQALIRTPDEHRTCMELGSEDFPVVLTVDD